jgi:hypothetical protein
MVTPSLPVDKDRYIDFLQSDGTFSEINYPYLYRIKLENTSDINLSNISVEIDKILDIKSQEFNNIVKT